MKLRFHLSTILIVMAAFAVALGVNLRTYKIEEIMEWEYSGGRVIASNTSLNRGWPLSYYKWDKDAIQRDPSSGYFYSGMLALDILIAISTISIIAIIWRFFTWRSRSFMAKLNAPTDPSASKKDP